MVVIMNANNKEVNTWVAKENTLIVIFKYYIIIDSVCKVCNTFQISTPLFRGIF